MTRPLEGSGSLQRLGKYAGLRPAERLYEIADIVNLIEEYPGGEENGKRDKFPVDLGVRAANNLKPRLQSYPRVVLLGGAVRTCFGRAGIIPKSLGWFEGYERWRGYKLTIISPSPHPAGTSMFWNDPAGRAAGEAFWQQVIREAT